MDYRTAMPTDDPAVTAPAPPASRAVAPAGRLRFLRRPVRIAFTLIAAASLLVLTLLASNLGGLFRAGPLRITINDFEKPLLWGFAGAAALLIQEWRRTAWRRTAILLLSALAVLAMVNFARDLTPIVTAADFAVIELYTELATEGRLLLGPYSRFGWNHPGPLYFYLQAPLYALGGHKAASLYAGALAINLASIIALAWVTAREKRGWLLVCLTAACVVFAWRVPRFLASPWTAHVPILPSLAFAVLCAATASGRWRLLPLTIVFGTFVAQTHLALVPMVALLLGAVVMLGLARAWSGDAAVRSILHASAWIAVVLWLLPISEALSHAGGNVAELWHFFVANPGDGHPLREAFVYWSYGLTGILRPDFALPWGGHIALQHLWWAVACAIGQVLLLAAILRRDVRAGRRFEACLAAAALSASSLGLWALTRIRGDIVDHEIFWLSALGALNVAVIGSACLRVLPLPAPRRWSADALAIGACVVLLLLGLNLGVAHLKDLTSFELRRTERAVIPATHTAIRSYLGEEDVRSPIIRIDGERWSEAAGVLLRLYQDRIPFSLDDPSLPMFAETFSVTGQEDAVIHIGTLEGHRELRGRPSNAVILEAHPLYVDAIRITPVSVRGSDAR